jgi:WD40 repeat protein
MASLGTWLKAFSLMLLSLSCTPTGGGAPAVPFDGVSASPIEVAVGLESRIRNTRGATLVEEDPNSIVRGDSIRTHFAHSSEVNALVVSADGNTAFSGGRDGSVVRSELIYPSKLRQVRTEILLESTGPILGLALSPSERLLAVSQFSSIVVYHIERREIVARMTRIQGRIVHISWDPREELIAAGLATGELFVWNAFRGEAAGEDSSDALEQYENFGVSPVVGIVFHPSARALFVAERIGEVKLWRLVRTDEELGLRDSNAVIDRKSDGRLNLLVGKIANSLEDIELSSDGEYILAADSKGYLHKWKVRGLKYQTPVQLDRSGLFAVRPLIITASDARRYQLLASSGREQTIKFWCADIVPTIPISEEEFGGPATVIIDGLAIIPTAPVDEPPSFDAYLGRTSKFENPPTLLEISSESSRLWAAEKTGSLLTFDAGEVLRFPVFKRCR